MKASEILRKLADVIDSQSTAQVGAGDHNRSTLEPVAVDNTDILLLPLCNKKLNY